MGLVNSVSTKILISGSIGAPNKFVEREAKEAGYNFHLRRFDVIKANHT
jgi:hypothetical protein